MLQLAGRFWRGEVPPGEYHPVSHLGGLAEICDGVAGSPRQRLRDQHVSGPGARRYRQLVRRRSRARRTAPLDRPPVAHRRVLARLHRPRARRERLGGGVCVSGGPAPVAVAHEALPLRFDRYIMRAGYDEVINQRQFGAADRRWPTEYRLPDRTYRDHLTLHVGDASLLLRHEKGETDDHTVTWLPDKRVGPAGHRGGPHPGGAGQHGAAAGGARQPDPRGDERRRRPRRRHPRDQGTGAAAEAPLSAAGLAGHLAQLAFLAEPGDPAIAQARHRVFAVRADLAGLTMSTCIFGWAANEALGDEAQRPDPPVGSAE